MKITKFNIFIIASLIVLISPIQLKTDNSNLKSTEDESKKKKTKGQISHKKTLIKNRNGTAPAAAAKVAVPVAPKGGNATLANNTKETNVAGNPKLDVQIVAAPYTLTNCDQVLLFPGKRIFPANDYTKKIPAYFSMNAYMINAFSAKNSSDLLQSVSMANMKQMPMILQGSKDCLSFQDGVTFRSFTMCLDLPILTQIQTAFQIFFNCRNGFGFNSNPNVNDIMKLMCGTNKTAPNYTALRGKFKEEMTKVGLIVTEIPGEGAPLANTTVQIINGREVIIDNRVPGTY